MYIPLAVDAVAAVAAGATARIQTAVRANVANTVTVRLRDGRTWMLLGASPTGGVSEILMVSSPQRECQVLAFNTVIIEKSQGRSDHRAQAAQACLTAGDPGKSLNCCWRTSINSSLFAAGGSFLPDTPVRARRQISADAQALQSSFDRSSTIVDAMHQSRSDSGLAKRRHAPRRARGCEPPTTARPACRPSRPTGEARTVRSG